MTATFTRAPGYADFTDPCTLRIQRRMPGPIDRVWAYLTDSELRGQWLASGEMAPHPSAPFELVWRNDRLSESPHERPDGFPQESRATCVLTEIDPPRLLRFTWPDVGDVTITLEPSGGEVLLTLVHRGCAGTPMKVMVAAGWHTHLDILVARVQDAPPPSFWATWQGLKADYEHRIVD